MPKANEKSSIFKQIKWMACKALCKERSYELDMKTHIANTMSAKEVIKLVIFSKNESIFLGSSNDRRARG